MKLLGCLFSCILLANTSLISAAEAPSIRPQIQLASKFAGNVNITDYLVSEKLDGVRGYWDGQFLRSKNGYIFNAPKWFTKGFGEQAMDGELWLGRGKFEQTLSIVSKLIPIEQEWQTLRFMLFDLPKSDKAFSERVIEMQHIVAQVQSNYLQMIPQYTVDNHLQLKNSLEAVVSNGGEGLMLHKKQALYQVGRSNNIVKLKVHEDAEATVLAHYQGKGKFTGKLGSILVENSQGIRFKIGSGFSIKERENPPEIGSKITYKFFGVTKNGKPKFASFIRLYNNL